MNDTYTGTIYGVNGPVVYIKGKTAFKMGEMVYVGNEKLVGEIISLTSDITTIQVYEETSGLKPGDIVYSTGSAIFVTLAPGIINNIFDGIERPLKGIAEKSGIYISRGISVDSLDTEKKWDVHVTIKEGQYISGGTIIAEVPETKSVLHKSMVPPYIEGTVKSVVPDGEYTINDTIATITLKDGGEYTLTLTQKWPIRVPRPISKKYSSSIPLVTGQRILDTLFPIAKGGTAAIPGGFGTGKTMSQHQIAKWSDADIIIYIGCGERGNEMTEVLEDFSKLVDPKSSNPLMYRTSLIANTSNMPVAAREASIYTGITLAEYYRDMGYHVAIMADSTSRWAEALRELSGRLEEMPAEEGFPAYLASKLSAFYERAGYVQNLNNSEGSVSIIGAVSPQGGDFSEPVTQNTKRFVRCFWGLDKSLAYARHFPAIHWLTSYSEYLNDLAPWYDENVSPEFIPSRNNILAILNQESSLIEIVKLIGSDVLPDDQKLTLEIARVIRLGFLQQNAFHKDDTCVSLKKQLLMMKTILYLNERSKALVSLNMPMSVLKESDIFDKVIAMKYDVPNDHLEYFDNYKEAIDNFYDEVILKNG
ncbi:MAG: V-type ATP synthase subunit A [Lachnospiraceae bacterium]|nr:V-type ATP synthase subunit A [Lachnospiraceae bacterium]